MDVKKKVDGLYLSSRGEKPLKTVALKGSGSNRRYFRIYGNKETILAAFNDRKEENDAFVGFSRHFIAKNLPVPLVFDYYRDENIYFLEDLGPWNLFECLTGTPGKPLTGDEATIVYAKALDQLLRFQVAGHEGLDYELCYPYRSFDVRSMMWDLNYFKYSFLNLMAVPYHEQRLEQDFIALCAFLSGVRADFFMYRDFQSANIILRDLEPWFIDYQGGRKGALQYDVASLLYDSKAHIPGKTRNVLLNAYLNRLEVSGIMDRKEFMAAYPAFAMIRLMQALGAFGFRGLYEKKDTFTESIVPAVELLAGIIENQNIEIELGELFRTINSISSTRKYEELLTEDINIRPEWSFSSSDNAHMA